MADIFVSYAHEDVDRVRDIVENLKASGYSVVWDRDLPAGYIDEDIPNEIAAAGCLIVAWSRFSVSSRPVKDEVSRADKARKLVALRIDPIEPPYPYANFRYEDFVGWKGDTTAEPWRRLVELHLSAFVGPPRDASGPPSRRLAAQSARPEAADGYAPRYSARPRSLGLASLALLLVVAVAGLAYLSDRFLADLVADKTALRAPAAFVALGGVLLLLFRAADVYLAPNLKALAARWLLPIDGGVSVGAGEAFALLFQSVYGRNHLSWLCFWRSALTSIAFMAVSILVLVVSGVIKPDDYLVFPEALMWSFGEQQWTGLLGALAVILLLPNVVGDYLTLYSTRFLLTRMRVVAVERESANVVTVARNRLDLADRWPILAASFAAAAGIWALVAYPSWILSARLLGETNAMSDPGAVFKRLVDLARGAYVNPADYDNVNYFMGKTLLGNLATALAPSLWLVSALILAPFSRALVWNAKTGPNLLGRALGVRHRPFTVFGLVSFCLTALVGAAILALDLGR